MRGLAHRESDDIFWIWKVFSQLISFE